MSKLKNEALLKTVVEQVNEVLNKNGCKLQPFLTGGEMGLIPAVRVVIEKENDTDRKAKADKR